MKKIHLSIISIMTIYIAVLLFSNQVCAYVFFYTNESDWLSNASYDATSKFLFTADNVALSNEVSTSPEDTDLLGQILTFEKINTGFFTDFTFKNESPDSNTQVVYINKGAGLEGLGSGTTSHHDWSVNFIDGFDVFEIGLHIAAGSASVNDYIKVYDKSGGEIGSFGDLPAYVSFVGIISDDFNSFGSIVGVKYDDDPQSQGTILTGLSHPIPEPATMLLLGSGLIGMAGVRRKLKKERR